MCPSMLVFEPIKTWGFKKRHFVFHIQKQSSHNAKCHNKYTVQVWKEKGQVIHLFCLETLSWKCFQDIEKER